jgi:hypothetical protein
MDSSEFLSKTALDQAAKQFFSSFYFANEKD